MYIWFFTKNVFPNRGGWFLICLSPIVSNQASSIAATNSKVALLKPFNIEDKKDTNGTVSEVTANKWQGCMLQNIRKEPKWIPLLDIEWNTKKTPNRGAAGRPEEPGPPVVPAVPAATVAAYIDSMLEYVSQYAPNCLYRHNATGNFTHIRLAPSQKMGQIKVFWLQTPDLLAPAEKFRS